MQRGPVQRNRNPCSFDTYFEGSKHVHTVPFSCHSDEDNGHERTRQPLRRYLRLQQHKSGCCRWSSCPVCGDPSRVFWEADNGDGWVVVFSEEVLAAATIKQKRGVQCSSEAAPSTRHTHTRLMIFSHKSNLTYIRNEDRLQRTVTFSTRARAF